MPWTRSPSVGPVCVVRRVDIDRIRVLRNCIVVVPDLEGLVTLTATHSGDRETQS